MKKVIFAALLLVIMFVIDANGEEQKLSIESKPLTKVKSVILEENESVILSDIIDCDINSNASNIVLTSGIKRIIAIYDFKNGNLLHFKKAELYLSDSIKHTNRFPPNYTNDNYTYQPVKYLSLEECREIGFTDFIMIKNVFINVNYNKNNNDLSSLALIYLPTFMKNIENTAYNTAAIIKFDSTLNIKRVIFPNNTSYNYTIPFSYIVDENNTYYIPNESRAVFIEFNKKDSIPVLSIYDNNGEYIRTALFLDEIYANDVYINLLFMHIPKTTTINNKHFAMFPYSPNTFYNLSTDDTISLSNPIVNYSEKYEEARNEIKKLDKNESSTKVIDEYMPISVFKLMNNGKNLIICYMEKVEDYASFIFREYDINGKFISERTFENEDELNIQNMLYDKKNNYIVLFVKGEENWTIEKYSW